MAKRKETPDILAQIMSGEAEPAGVLLRPPSQSYPARQPPHPAQPAGLGALLPREQR